MYKLEVMNKAKHPDKYVVNFESDDLVELIRYGLTNKPKIKWIVDSNENTLGFIRDQKIIFYSKLSKNLYLDLLFLKQIKDL